MTSQEDVEFEEAWATYTRLQSDRVLWNKIKARERYENDLRLRLGGARRKGIARGRASVMKQEGLDPEHIAKLTGLSLPEIEQLGHEVTD